MIKSFFKKQQPTYAYTFVPEEFVWAMGSMCALNRIAFDPQLMLNQFPLPLTLDLEDEEDDYITMQEQAALVEAEDHNANKDNIFKMEVDVKPGSLVEAIQKNKGSRAAKV